METVATQKVGHTMVTPSTAVSRFNTAALGKMAKDNWKTIAAVAVPVAVITTATAVWYRRRRRERRDALRRSKLMKSASAQAKCETTSPSKTSPNKNGSPAVASTPQATTKMAGKLEETPIAMRSSLDLTETSQPSNDAAFNSACEKARDAKARGNKLYSSQKYEEACVAYTDAINASPEGDMEKAVYYGNRAACYSAMKEHTKVIDDCNRALKVNPQYVRAVLRRAHALENLGEFEEALVDYTAAIVLDNMKNETAALAAERLLKNLSVAKTSQHAKTRVVKMPSTSFIEAYLSSFSYDIMKPLASVPATEKSSKSATSTPTKEQTASSLTGDKEFQLAVSCLKKSDHDGALKHIKLAIDNHTSMMTRALNWRGTYYYLLGDLVAAKKDFDLALTMPIDHDEERINLLIKRANLESEMDKEEPTAANNNNTVLTTFDAALNINADHADIYYHRGQLYSLRGQLTEAIKDYERALTLNKKLLFAHVQLGVAHYRAGNIEEAMTVFQKAVQQFKQSPFVHNYYGEILLDQQRLEEAMKAFDTAIKLDKTCPLPYINKALLMFHGHQRLDDAIQLCEMALKQDDRSDVAYANLAQFEMQRGNLDKAIEIFDRALDYARSDLEMTNIFMCREAAVAQLRVLQRFKGEEK